MPRPNRKLQLAFGYAILSLLLVAIVSYRGMILSSEGDRWSDRSRMILRAIRDVVVAEESVESSSNAYALTGDPSYLRAYRAGVIETSQDVQVLNDVLSNDPGFRQNLSTLNSVLNEKARRRQDLVNARAVSGIKGALAAVDATNDLRLTDRFDSSTTQLRTRELEAISRHNAAIARSLNRGKLFLILEALSGLSLALLAAWNAKRNASARRLAEHNLRNSEEKYKILLDGVQDHSIFLLDPEGFVLSWNVGAERTRGFTAEEIIGQHFSRFFLPENVASGRPAEVLRQAAEHGRFETHAVSLRKDGSQFLAGITITALRDADGKLQGFSEISQDVDANRESEARYRGLLEAAPDAMVVVNSTGEIVLLNVQAEQQFGYRRDELLGQKVINIIPEGFAERLIADGTRTAAEALAQQIGMGIELFGRRKDGTGFPIEMMLSPLQSPDGILVTAAIRNISVRKAAEMQLEQTEAKYRGLLEAAPDAMVVVNGQGEIVLLNVQAEKQFGYRRDELLGQEVTNIIPEGFAERLVADALRSAEDALAQQIGMGIELYGRRKDQTSFPIEIMLSPLASVEGVLVTAAIRDISVRQLAEANLLQKVEELKRSNEELGQFAYIASHDLQEPLRMVASYTQLLSRRYKGRLDSDADDFIAFAVDGANRMQRLIQDLLAYSRVETKGKVLVGISSCEALEQALLNLSGAIQESGAIITHDDLPAVLADETQLVQLFQNLIANAIKYQSAGTPRAHISVSKTGKSRWTFSVADNGIGIEPQYFDRIFGMFQRLHKRAEFDGTGIGLAICKKIVERHGGAISVESVFGQGSTFHFSLAGADKALLPLPEMSSCQ